ncbi:hypothetical protein QF037_001891 [Streptomyces canus]|nr:hypothetical protein [Streptomyces canus]MDQ0597546.1 hypothetical protein [Streptomyces canus]
MTWAGRALEAAAQVPGRMPETDAALEPAGDRERWHRGAKCSP